jgi:hypothetical protein
VVGGNGGATAGYRYLCQTLLSLLVSKERTTAPEALRREK